MKKQLPPIKFQELDKKDVYNLTGGFNDNANQLLLDDSEISGGLNIVLDSDSIWTGRGGIQYEGNYIGPATKILGLHEFYKTSSGVRYPLAVYDTNAYLLSSGIWTGQGLTLTSGHRAWFCDGDNKVYMTNGYDDMRSFDGSSWATLSNFPVSGADTTQSCHGVSFFKERIIGWNTDANPNRVYYSDQGAETIGALNYFDIHEPVKCCIDLSEAFMLVFSENYIYRVDTFFFTGATYSPDKLQQLIVGKGAIADKSIIKIGNYIYYLSRDGFKMTDGVVEKNLSNSKIKQFFNSLDKVYLQNAVSGTIDGLWYIACSVNGTKNDTIIIYDTLKGIWYPPFQVSDDLNISCLTTFVQSSVEKLFGGSDLDGAVYSFNNTNFYDDRMITSYETSNDADAQIAGGTTVRKAQSFQVSVNSTIQSIDALLKKVSGTTTGLTVRIETDNSGPSGTLAHANATTTIEAFSSTSYLWKRAIFSSSFILSQDTTYWLVIQHTNEGSGNSVYAWASDDSSPAYALGAYASYSSSTWSPDITKDLLFRINIQDAYEKYLITKGFYLGDPQKTKKVRKIFHETLAIGNYDFYIGINTDLYNDFVEYMINVFDNSVIRGSSLTRGAFIRGTIKKIKEFLEPDDIRGRMIKLRYYNNKINENFKVIGAIINYETINLLR